VKAAAWRATFAATALMGVTMGSRSAFGLFLSPLNGATGIGMGVVSLAVALGHLALGLSQPGVAGLAERHGAARVIVGGAAVLAASTALLAFAHDAWGFAALVVAMAVAGSALGSNAMLMGEVGRRVPAGVQGLAAGIVGAGGSAGQLVFGPVTQWLIGDVGWRAALWATAAVTLIAVPVARVFARPAGAAPAGAAPQAASTMLRQVLADRRFQLIAASFAMCGFHVAFLTTHMPGVMALCGLPASLSGTWLAVAGASNIVGSIGVGMAMKRWSSPTLLALLYGTRAAAIAALLLAPATSATLLAFGVVMGLTYLAPLGPTAELVARHFGVQRLGTLFGVVMVAHQAGSFAGAWLGGVAVDSWHSYTPLWIADGALALAAALLRWPLATGIRATPPSAAPRRSACAARPAAPGV